MVKKHYQFAIIYVCVALLVFVSSMMWGIVTNKPTNPPPPVCTITIKTLEPNGNTLSGVQIKIKNHRDTYYKVTNNNGQAVQRMRNLLPGDVVRVEANKSGYEPVSSSPGYTVIKEGQEEYELTFIMQEIPPEIRECTVVVTTVDDEGNGLGGVRVEIRKDPDIYDVKYTDNTGRVSKSVSNPHNGDTIHVGVNKNGYELVSSSPRHIIIREAQKRYEQTHILQRVTPKPMSRYVIEFYFQDQTGAQIPGVSVHRNNVHIGESDQRGTFRDTLESLSSSNKYSFKKQYYWPPTWNMTNYPAGQPLFQTTITMQKLLLSIRCVDTTGIYADNLENIEISRTNGTHLCWTDVNGGCENIALPTASIRLRFRKESIFLQQEHEIIAQMDRVTEVVLNPRKGSLAITVMMRKDSSVVPNVEVTAEGNGFYESKITNDQGKVHFTNPRIIPGKKYTVQVGSETQTTWLDKWDTERNFFLSD